VPRPSVRAADSLSVASHRPAWQGLAAGANGKVSQVTDRNGQVTGVSYDNLNRVSQVGFGATVSNPTTYTSTIDYTYDTGNRAYFGYDPAEILELGGLIRHVHIKDKEPGGKNVMLGTGKVDFKSVFANLDAVGYDGPLILETCRGEEDVQAGRDNLAFVKALLR